MLAHRIETTIDQDQTILLENLPCLTLALKTAITFQYLTIKKYNK
jgi:hypothetical protein